MTHYLESQDGKFRIEIEMGCNHPAMKNNSTESVCCDGDCSQCGHSIAKTTIPEMLELLNRAKCTKKK